MARDRLPWFRIGCLSIIVLPVLLILLGVGVAKIAPRGDTVVRESLRELPAAGSSPATAVPGRVKLAFSGVELLLKASPAGSPLTVRVVDADTSTSLLESYRAGTGDGWSYEAEFNGGDESLLAYVLSMAADSVPKVAVSIPRGTPLALEVKLVQGGGLVDLGGLWLTSFELTLQRGGLELDVSEPLPEPLQRFESTGSMGGIEFKSLGNASPRQIEISQRMGGVEVDLGGQWRDNADVEISINMGGGEVQVPENVRLHGEGAGDGDAFPEAGEDLPVLTISTRVNMGEVEVLRDG